jgi:hypothetical protein
MDGRRPAQGLNSSRRRVEGAEADSAIEREIEAALAVDPSPEFVAKVRARIASEPTRASWWHLRWPMVATAAAAAGVVMAVAWSWQPGVPERIAVGRGTDVVLTAATAEPATPQVSAEKIANATRSRRGGAIGTPPSGSREPEVLISRDEQRGLELLLTAVRDGRLTPTLAAQLVAGDATVEADIPISDIVIEPLPQIAALGGEEQ